jgi:hypothetical protein
MSGGILYARYAPVAFAGARCGRSVRYRPLQASLQLSGADSLRLSRQPGSHSDHACWTSHRCPGTQLKSWQIVARRTTASWPVAMAAYIPRRNSKNKSFKPSSLISQKQGNACTRMAEFAETITRRRWLRDQCPCSWYWILPLRKRILV